MAHAILTIGGHQYKVGKGDVIEIDRVPGEPGHTLTWDEVMMVEPSAHKETSAHKEPSAHKKEASALIGTPYIKGAEVHGVIAEQSRNPKILVFKKKRRKGYKRLKGHKQPITAVTITEIKVPS